MNTDSKILIRQAVEAALNNRWQDVVDINIILHDQNPRDISTLNRLAKGYEEIGQIKSAKKTYEKVLKLDKYNRIALNNLSRLKPIHEDIITPQNDRMDISTIINFIEEAGKTKTINLTKLAPSQILSKLHHGQSVLLKANNRRISIITQKEVYIGCLPDDISLHLIKLIKSGNHYEAAIKNITPSNIEVFIRETKKSARLKGLPSFPTKDTNYYYQFLPTEPIAEVPLELVDSNYSEN